MSRVEPSRAARTRSAPPEPAPTPAPARPAGLTWEVSPIAFPVRSDLAGAALVVTLDADRPARARLELRTIAGRESIDLALADAPTRWSQSEGYLHADCPGLLSAAFRVDRDGGWRAVYVRSDLPRRAGLAGGRYESPRPSDRAG